MANPTTTTIAALRQTLDRKNREVWACTTDWSTILEFEGDAAAYMSSPVTTVAERIARDAQCIVLLESVLTDAAGGLSSVPYPFRAGPKACNALPTYKRYHAAWLASYKITKFIATGDDAQLASAYSHLVMTWQHSEETCPPQLRPSFVAVALALLMLLVYNKGPAPGIKTSAVQSASAIDVLRFVQSIQPESYGPVCTLLAIEVAAHWVHYESDPRAEASKFSDLSASSVAAAAVAHIAALCPQVNDVAAITRFSRISAMSCDRKDMGIAQFEYSVNSPLPLRLPLAAAWKLAYIVRAQAKLSLSAKPLDAPIIRVVARLLHPERGADE